MRPWLHVWASPLGSIDLAVERSGALVYLGFSRPEHRSRLPKALDRDPDGLALDPEPLAPVRRQLEEYFRGERRAFDLPLALRGTPFQLRVWAELQRIPYGATISYGELARRLGDPNLTRAVGAANGANPVSIIVPCHRVIGADGSLTGYGGGLENKRALLALEKGLRGFGPVPDLGIC
ncbi:MAG: methylated-DNA--[protein]-cysteine S-methyltransferase [Holophaga sp.]|nr:methylated-DNA--[protein]-cysteine S-methyltransferase [Holophaga sp.]